MGDSGAPGANQAAALTLEKVAEHTLKIKGHVGFKSVVGLKKQGEEFLRSGPRQCVIDLSGVAGGGSAAVSLLLSWMRYSKARNVQLNYCDVPTDMLDIVQLYGLDQLLPILVD